MESGSLEMEMSRETVVPGKRTGDSELLFRFLYNRKSGAIPHRAVKRIQLKNFQHRGDRSMGSSWPAVA